MLCEQGCTYEYAARQLGVPKNVVRMRCKAAYQGLGLRSVAEAVEKMREEDWHEPPLPAGCKLYLQAFDRFLGAMRNQAAKTRALAEMRYLMPVAFIEKQAPVPAQDADHQKEHHLDISAMLELLLT
jgi:hypothetical protein